MVLSFGTWLNFKTRNQVYTARVVKPESIKITGELQFKWPNEGHFALGAKGYGVLAKNYQEERSKPIASIAKIMTVMAVLDKKPLKPGEPGETITVTDADDQIYRKYVEQEGSVIPLKESQTITQLEAIQASLIESANNTADLLAIWAFGSMEEYLKYANEKSQNLGLANTYFDDATGFSPRTVSTPGELVILGSEALDYPVIKEVAGTWQATILEETILTNTNTFLDFEGNNINGIKSGYTDEALGTFLGSATYTSKSGQTLTVIGAALGVKSHFNAQKYINELFKTIKSSTQSTLALPKETVVGEYSINNQTYEAYTAEDINLLLPPGTETSIEPQLEDLVGNFNSTENVGHITLNNDKTEQAQIKLRLKN